VEGDEWVVHDLVLETTQVVIEGDDVFFEDNSAGQSDPALVALNTSAGDGEPLVQFVGLANESPHFFGAAVNKVAATNGTHGSKLMGAQL